MFYRNHNWTGIYVKDRVCSIGTIIEQVYNVKDRLCSIGTIIEHNNYEDQVVWIERKR